MSPVRALLIASLCWGTTACTGGDSGDTEAPDPPALTGTDPTSPSRTNDPEVLGTTEPGASVIIYSDAACTQNLGRGTANEAGGFRIQVSVDSNITVNLHGTATDDAGNQSACGNIPLVYVEDSLPPQVLTIDEVDPEGPADEDQVTLDGSTEGNALVRIYAVESCAGTPLAEVTADASGAFTATVTVPSDATTTFHVTARDSAFNTTACTETVSYTEDSTPPARPTVASTLPTSPANNENPTLRGTAEANATVHVYSDETCTTEVGSTTADATGAWALAVTVASNSDTTYYATATDGVGLVSTCSAGLVYTEDSVNPPPPDFTHTTPSSPNVYGEPLIHGRSEAWSTVRLYADALCAGTLKRSGLADTSGNFALKTDHSNGVSTTYYGTATDRAGNASGCVGSITYTDAGAPSVLQIVRVDPQGDPKRLSALASLRLETYTSAPTGTSITWLWEILEGEGALENEATAAPTFTAGATPGLVVLQVTATSSNGNDSRTVYMQVEPDGESWFTVAEGMSSAWADRLDLEPAPSGLPHVLGLYDAESELYVLPGDHLGATRVISVLDADADYNDVDMVVDLHGNPWVIYADGTPTPDRLVHVVRWTGSAWQEVGDLSSYGASYSVAITFDDKEQAWIAFDSADSVVVATLVDGAWEAVGDPIVDDDTTHGIGHLALVIRGSTAAVGYGHHTNSEASAASVFLYESGDWVEAGNLSSSAYTLSDLKITSGGALVASYPDGNASYAPVVKRYIPSNNTWSNIGSLSSTASVNRHSHLAIDHLDNLYVVVGNEVRYTEDWATWAVVGGAPFGSMQAGSRYADLTVREHLGNRILYLAYPDCFTSADSSCQPANGNLTTIKGFVLR